MITEATIRPHRPGAGLAPSTRAPRRSLERSGHRRMVRLFAELHSPAGKDRAGKTPGSLCTKPDASDKLSAVILNPDGICGQIAAEQQRMTTLRGGESWLRGDPDYLREEGETVGFGRKGFFLACIDRNLANELIRRHHYSRKVVVTSVLHLGIFGEGRLQGVLQFGFAMNVMSMAKIVAGTKVDEYLELNRMWLCDSLPRNSESRAIAYAMTLIRAVRPKIGWVQSFADDRCKRQGVVYQASNFLYCGEHTSPFWELDGEFYHNIHMTRRTNPGPRGIHLQANRHRAVRHLYRQFRYIYFLKAHFRKRLLLKVHPYPKHAEQDSMVSRPATSREGRVQIPGSAPFKFPSEAR